MDGRLASAAWKSYTLGALMRGVLHSHAVLPVRVQMAMVYMCNLKNRTVET